jgi:hypothetical protein
VRISYYLHQYQCLRGDDDDDEDDDATTTTTQNLTIYSALRELYIKEKENIKKNSKDIDINISLSYS